MEPGEEGVYYFHVCTFSSHVRVHLESILLGCAIFVYCLFYFYMENRYITVYIYMNEATLNFRDN